MKVLPILAGLLLAVPAAAQMPPSTAPNVPPAPAAAPASGNDAAMKQAIDQRIAALQSRLGITQAEMSDWNNFANVMRDNATNTNTLFQQRAANAATMSAVDNMKSYAAIARAYADNTQRLSDAFSALYAKLTPDQQRTADELFREKPPQETSKRRR